MAVKKYVLMCGCAVVLMLKSTFLSASPLEWKKIAEGISYTELNQVHVFQIHLKQFRLSVAMAKEFGLQNATVKDLAKKTKAVLAINGSFFSPDNKSLGLLMRDGQILNPLHATPWWAIFYIEDQKPKITPPASFQATRRLEMALQVGPRLVVQGKTTFLKPSLARRSGIGIKKDSTIVIAVTENKELPIQEFAALFQKKEEEGGLDCIDVLNLDGGGSSQLYFNWNGFSLDIPGPSLITNAITVFPR